MSKSRVMFVGISILALCFAVSCGDSTKTEGPTSQGVQGATSALKEDLAALQEAEAGLAPVGYRFANQKVQLNEWAAEYRLGWDTEVLESSKDIPVEKKKSALSEYLGKADPFLRRYCEGSPQDFSCYSIAKKHKLVLTTLDQLS